MGAHRKLWTAGQYLPSYSSYSTPVLVQSATVEEHRVLLTMPKKLREQDPCQKSTTASFSNTSTKPISAHCVGEPPAMRSVRVLGSSMLPHYPSYVRLNAQMISSKQKRNQAAERKKLKTEGRQNKFHFYISVKPTWIHFETRVQQNRIYFKCWIYKLL